MSGKFKNFFTEFDNDLDGLGIRSYGISVTTLEEVFLKVGHGDDTNDDLAAKEAVKNAKLTKGQQQQNIDEEYRLFK